VFYIDQVEAPEGRWIGPGETCAASVQMTAFQKKRLQVQRLIKVLDQILGVLQTNR
jgi:hypothetical protein